MENNNTISILPTEIWIKIFSYLQVRFQRILRLVCKEFKELIDFDYKFMQQCEIRITRRNVEAAKKLIANQNNGKIIFKDLILCDISSSDMQYILKNVGETVDHLTMFDTEVLESLTGYVKNLKSLSLFIDYSKRNFKILNLFDFPLLENLDLECYNDRQTNLILCQLVKKPNKIKSLKLKATLNDKILIDILMRQTSIEILKIELLHSKIEFDNLWKQAFTNLVNLRTLKISCNTPNWLEMMFTSLPKETPLENIDLDSMCVDDQLLTIITHKWKETLKSIIFDSCTLSDVGLMQLNKLTKLRVLQFGYCDGLTSKGILNGIAAKENLVMEELHLFFSKDLDELDLISILSRLPNLRVLRIVNQENGNFNNTLAHIFHYQTRLRTLRISSYVITNDGIVGFGDNPCSINVLRELEELIMNTCQNLTDRSLTALKFPKLKTLELNKCHQLSTKGLQQLVKNCPLLENLGLSAKTLLDPNAVEVINKKMIFLRRLQVGFEYKKAKRDRTKVRQNLQKIRKSISLDLGLMWNIGEYEL